MRRLRFSVRTMVVLVAVSAILAWAARSEANGALLILAGLVAVLAWVAGSEASRTLLILAGLVAVGLAVGVGSGSAWTGSWGCTRGEIDGIEACIAEPSLRVPAVLAQAAFSKGCDGRIHQRFSLRKPTSSPHSTYQR
jgi:hypothetical protein